MPVLRTLPTVIISALLVALAAAPVSAAHAEGADAPTPRRACLGKAEQRAAVAAGKAVPLAVAIRALHAQDRRAEVVRAELCQRGDGLAYVLTLLARNGKVTRATVDAANGGLINGR